MSQELESALKAAVARTVQYYTYVPRGGCAWCSDFVKGRYVPVLGHKPDCAIKALTEAMDRGDYSSVERILEQVSHGRA